MQRRTTTHLRQSGNVEKSDENKETQPIEIGKNPLNFKHAEGGVNMCASSAVWEANNLGGPPSICVTTTS